MMTDLISKTNEFTSLQAAMTEFARAEQVAATNIKRVERGENPTAEEYETGIADLVLAGRRLKIASASASAIGQSAYELKNILKGDK